jgi:hypothetical protein
VSQLAQLAKPFPAKLVKKPPKGKYGSYVEHSTVTQALLAVCGAYSMHVTQVLRGFVPERKEVKDDKGVVKREYKPPLEDAVVGVIVALTVFVDGREVTVEEVGDSEEPHNWPNDGSRLKDAISDAIKRCSMRLGLGLHLWAQEDYFLDKSLAGKDAANENEPEPGPEESGKKEDADAPVAPSPAPGGTKTEEADAPAPTPPSPPAQKKDGVGARLSKQWFEFGRDQLGLIDTDLEAIFKARQPGKKTKDLDGLEWSKEMAFLQSLKDLGATKVGEYIGGLKEGAA